MSRGDALRATVAAGASVLLAALVGCKATSREREPEAHPIHAALLAPVNVDTRPAEPSTALMNVVHGAEAAPASRCREGMVAIEGRYCIDRYEASLLEIDASGAEQPFSPYSTVGNRRVRAISVPNVFPQGYISATQAGRACASSGKRLCRVSEWEQACRGPQNLRYGYGPRREPRRCNDSGRSPVVTMFGFRFDSTTMNHPQLNQMPGTLARTGEHEGCSNDYGVYDMVGNLHEWVADPNGSFRGGYYLDVASVGHGDGCDYRTTAHEARYHDYSTGFRCCADIDGGSGVPPKPAPKLAPKPAKGTKRGGKRR